MTEIEILRHALDWKSAGRRVAVCTVCATWGSAPKPVGSHLIVDSNGAFLGSVSGGCVEGEVIVEAVDVVESGRPRLLEFGVSDGLAWKAGLTCGGQIEVYVEPLDRRLQCCLQRLVESAATSDAAVMLTALDGAPPEVLGFEACGAHSMSAEIAGVLSSGKSRTVETGGRRYLLTVVLPATRLVVVGAVHIAQALSTIASLANLEINVVDPRSAFATTERFPGVRIINEWPSDIAKSIALRSTDAVAVLSHDPKIDDQGLLLALAARCFYVGALGSRRSHAKRLDRLREVGVAEQDLRRIHGPIGLDIGADGPAEIAVSIIAQIIAARRQMAPAAASDAA